MIVDVNKGNIEREHICCAISGKMDDARVLSKKSWLKQEFLEGLIFRKLDERGKVFIEFLPLENAWVPIEGSDYLFINCLWVSGKFKGHGYGKELLNECIAEAKEQGRKGLAILSADKKRPFLSDPKFLKYQGFRECDSATPYFKLYYLPFEENISPPVFKACCREGIDTVHKEGLVLYYTNQCPFTEAYAALLKVWGDTTNTKVTLIKLESKEEARNCPSPFTTYSLFKNGVFITNEILPEKKFNQLR